MNCIRVVEDNLEYSDLLEWQGRRTLHQSRKVVAQLSEHQILIQILV